MRIQNKYLRNRVFKQNAWNKCYKLTKPFKMWVYPWKISSYEEQYKDYLDWINLKARSIDKGCKSSLISPKVPRRHRKCYDDRDKAQERAALKKINNGYYETEVPVFKKDAAWDYY